MVYLQKVDFLVLYFCVFVLLQCFYIVHFTMNNIKKCNSSSIKNFFRTTLLQTFAIRDAKPQFQGCPQ